MLRSLTALLLALVASTVVVSAARSQDPAPKPGQKAAATIVNLNSATAAELESLPGIGAATATRIIEYRQKNGAFKKVEDLMNVRGIGEKTFLSLKPLITVAPPKGPGL